MNDRQQLIEAVYNVLETEERLGSEEAGLGEIVRLEVEILQLSEPQETVGRSGSFFKMAVEYSLLIEHARDVEEGQMAEPETHRRTLRLSADGKIVGVSDRL